MLLAVPVAATVKNLIVLRRSSRSAEQGAVVIDGTDSTENAEQDDTLSK